METVSSTYPSLTHSLILVGDFNVNVSDCRCSQIHHLNHFMASYCLQNQVLSPTRVTAHGESTIDLLLSHAGGTRNCRVLPSFISDHYAILSEIETSLPKLRPVLKEGRNMKRLDFRKLSDMLQEAYLENCQNAENVEDAWEMWICQVQSTLDKCAPMRKYRPKRSPRNLQEWKTSEYHQEYITTYSWYHDAVVQRDLAHRKWRQNPTNLEFQAKFAGARAFGKRLGRQLKRSYFSRVFANCAGDSRSTWNVLKRLTGKTRKDHNLAVTANDLANQFGTIVY